MNLRLSLLAVALVTVCAASCDPPKEDGDDGVDSGEGEGEGGVDCPAGSRDCPCDAGACDDGLVCDADDTCAVDRCPAGTLGCPCDAGGCVDGGICNGSGSCESLDCPAGQEGCACRPLPDGGACDTSDAGQVLSCNDDNVCASDRCAPGDSGCVCLQGAQCASSADACSDDGYCVPAGCVAGTLGCGCAGGACNGDLRCFDGAVCADAAGTLGGACFDNGRCLTGNRCQNTTCVPCSLGQQGCACEAGGGCVEGLECDDGQCTASVGFALSAPTSPQCWTPCSGPGLVDGDVFRECPVDGLMAGCLPGLSCNQGSCVPPDGAPRTCDINTACPDFQSCLGGQCVSNCSSNAECQSVADCVDKVCRKRCTIVEANCPEGSFCATDDGEAGHCVEEVDPGAPSAEVPSELFVSTSAIVLSSAQTGSAFTITNDSPLQKHITIAKQLERHTVGGLVESIRLGATSTVRQNPAACTPGSLGCRCSNADTECLSTSLGVALTCNDDELCALPTCTEGSSGCVCGADGSCGKVCDGPDCPLAWISLTARIDGQLAASGQNVAISFELPAGDSVRVAVEGAGGTDDAYYDGEIVVDDGSVKRSVQLSYSRMPEGAWTGEMFTFGDFRVNEAGLATWMARKDAGVSNSDVAGIKNAFLQAWANFRRGNLSFAKFAALATSTKTESWRDPSIVARCGTNKICFPFLNDDGFDTYTLDPAGEPVPSGVVSLPFGMNLQQDAGTAFKGRVRTSSALHYGGDPEASLTFKNDPTTCSVNNAAGCLVFVSSFSATSAMGGRYRAETCAPRYTQTRLPWLVPGFLAGTVLDPVTGRRFQSECRDTLTPFVDGDAAAAANASLAGGNPLLDGRERKRTLSLVDGALINSDTMFIIFKETIPALVGNDPADDLVAYGYMFLSRESTVPSDDDFIGNAPPASLPPPPAIPALGCSPSITSAINGKVWDAQVNIVMGEPALSGQTIIFSSTTTESTTEQVHYLCADTNRFDTVEECPFGSKIDYFTVRANLLSRAQVLGDSCNTPGPDGRGTCNQALQRYVREGKVIQPKAAWRCEDPNLAYCSTNLFDLRAEKKFFGVSSAPLVFQEIRPAVDDAFRFRTRFQDRGGRNIGFAPSICVPGSDEVPYCYDPAGIEEIRDRNSCLVSLYLSRPGNADLTTKTRLENYLRESFAYDEVVDPALNISTYHAGFEKLAAELEVMLADDALTKALSSRFDLAGLQVASFPGSQLEPNGVNLSGVAGAEMALLYQASQQYSMVLDRFFELLPAFERILDENSGADIVDQTSIETYFDKVIRASTQKAHVWNEISKRYQNLGRPDLAKLVIDRAYTAGTIESTALSHLMIAIARKSQAQFIDGILRNIRRAQVSYSAALNDMRTQHQAIGDDVDYFGFPPDHIPFPAIESEASRDNGFEVALNRAQQRLELARQAEEAALSTTRSFDTDAASFQNELTRVENTYEAQLSELCGTFSAQGRVFPAIRKYASLDARAQLFGDPCGRMGTGQIHDSAGGVDLALVEMARARQAMVNLDAEINIEEQRIDEVCATTNAFRSATVRARNRQSSLQETIADWQRGLATADRAFSAAQTFSTLTKCTIGTSTDCPTAAVSVGLLAIGIAVNETAQFLGSQKIASLESDVRDLQSEEAEIAFAQQCAGADTDFAGQRVTSQGIAEIESKATIARLVLRMTELQLDGLREQYDMQQAISRAEQLRNQATRLQAEMEEVLQQTINVEAARNDPNVRIYKNDAVQTADTTFYSALREAFLATKVFEFHTSQTYADFDQLLLARMVSRGDFNLQGYLTGLEDAYRSFEDEQGVADLRVAVLSLRDDILKIPRISTVGEPLSSAQRIALLRERLADPGLLDDHGYISVAFNTGPNDTSPLTRDHKVKHVEAEIVTTGSVDPLARVYLRAAGTSAVQGIDGELDFYALPKRTAVINAFFSGDKVYDPQVYRSFRFSDRPLFNSRWELILNTVDEPDNDDLRTQDLTDIRVYIYYSDFTVY